MNKPPLNNQECVLQVLSNANLLLVDAGFPIEQRTVFGLGGDASDLAVSLEWHDAVGCKWVADFTEENLTGATISKNQIKLKDSGGEAVCVEFYDLKAGKV